MGRKMVKMAKITNEKTRITTYKKRKACLYKKATEFSTLCGVDTCLIVYGPSKPGDEVVMEPELWPKDESKVRNIISKYRDTVSSSCTKTYSIQECLDKNNSKVEKSKSTVPKYRPWDIKLDKCSLTELYAVFMAVENKIQEATNRNQTFDNHNTWSCGQFGYNQQYQEQQHQLFHMATMEHNSYSFIPLFNQMTSNTAEVACSSNVTEPMVMNGQNFFYGSCSDHGPYGSVVQRTAYMEPLQWGLGNSVFNNVKPFTDYPLRFAQVNNDLDDSSNHPA